MLVNCIAADLPTGAVFYLMRVAEYGMRALAMERSFTIADLESFTFADWHTLLGMLETKRDAVINWKRGNAKDLALEFYGGSIGRLQGFKDLYRDRVSHLRGDFSPLVAQDAFLNVREFMKLLAKYIREDNNVEIDWTAVALSIKP